MPGQAGVEDFSNATSKPVRVRTRKPRRTDSPAAIDRAARDAKCVELRRAGVLWDAIARQLGYSSSGHAHQCFKAYMANQPKELVADLRQVELDRLEQLQAAIWAQCLATGQNQHWAIDRCLKISDQRARLMGLNAPVRQEVTVLSETTVDKAIRELQEQLGAQAKAHGVEMPADMAKIIQSASTAPVN